MLPGFEVPTGDSAEGVTQQVSDCARLAFIGKVLPYANKS